MFAVAFPRVEWAEGDSASTAVIHYDSEYARDLAVRVAMPKVNVALAHRVADLVVAFVL